MTSILSLKNISKSFNGVSVLKSVNLTLKPGRIHALVGENGAGKSTLMRIISGIYEPDNGSEMLLNGKPYQPQSPKSAIEAGVAIIHQELNLLPDLTVTENLFLGREKVNKIGLIKSGEQRKLVAQALKRLRQDFSPSTEVGNLSIGKQQMVEIARAVLFDADVIIMDEPTDSLAEAETEVLFAVIRDLASKGKAIVYISHRLGEIFELCDDVSVLRDGEMVFTGEVKKLNEDLLIAHMVGREIKDQYPYDKAKPSAIKFEVKNLSALGVDDVSFGVAAGEILGFGGLMGAGRTELAKAIYGANKMVKGTILLDNKEITIHSPKDAVKAGISYVSEDRKAEGLIQSQGIGRNMTLSALHSFLHLGQFLNFSKERAATQNYVEAFSIKAASLGASVSTMSGGNQQKVSIAKSLMSEPQLIIFDEPTRGVDVGARREIYMMMNSLKEKGMAIILLSSDMPELLGMSDRVMVMANGRITGELSKDLATQEAVMALALAGKE
ncbi:sugar ABC transporter ATP-binding protein [Bartonella sp. HY329]|uniref:sugar ABC transporter ATP-binding protein n=1 Tax=unclassified Bartonella TaxID=2645622 RepID=UPI0021CA5A75|nr:MULTISPECIES: sugar ABC transporter ATP-binding protein [unclassified Bartonella]UXM94827.1 sugar ABC transporter ATP-binding protein [Bartonella sp. HY329]UXN09150.1 sugar ABC transporter ATP-binding protein [Bartonella sp. HY328]